MLPPIPPVVGPPATPGQPQNAPILNDIQSQIDSAPVSDDPFGILGIILVNNISFQLPVHNQTTVTAYIGRRNMIMDAKGNVLNALHYTTQTPSTAKNGEIQFSLLFNSDLKLKIMIIARNEFGSSFKELKFSHNRSCINASLIPTIIGDCVDHCIEATNDTGILEFKGTYKHANIDYLALDILGVDPLNGMDLIKYRNYTYAGSTPMQPGLASISTKLLDFGKDNTCLLLSSEIVEEKDDILNWRLLEGFVRLE
ncbi:hypothetical protein [Leptospira harrisiae]|uniref:hypothetical protein n=1 Tax=Leptospira harrisiae TaxID=2023189 RepID=UPI001FAE97C1|nr:hypothetical protein [Leptospira harrisiae]